MRYPFFTEAEENILEAFKEKKINMDFSFEGLLSQCYIQKKTLPEILDQVLGNLKQQILDQYDSICKEKFPELKEEE